MGIRDLCVLAKIRIAEGVKLDLFFSGTKLLGLVLFVLFVCFLDTLGLYVLKSLYTPT